MADVDCIWTFILIHYSTGCRRLVRHQPSPPSCRRSRPRDRRSRLRRTLSPPTGKIIFQLLSCLYLYDSVIQVPVRIRKESRRPTSGVDIPFRQYTGFRRHREVCAKPVYRRATPQGSLRKAGIPASDVLKVKDPVRWS